MLSMRSGFAMQNTFPLLQIKSYIYPFGFSILWGALMELSQLLVFTYRTADLKDLLANTLGAFVGLILSFFGTKLIKLLKLN